MIEGATWPRPHAESYDALDHHRARRRLLGTRSFMVGATLLLFMVIIALAAPWLGTMDPSAIHPAVRNQAPGFEEVVRTPQGAQVTVVHWMGTDTLGRDVYSRVAFGSRLSLILGAAVAAIAVTLGLAIGVLAGSARWLDTLVMRIMDGLMAIPPILLAIAVMSVSTAGLLAVIVAIVIPEIPRVVRLVRSVVLSARELPYIEAAVAIGTPRFRLVVVHLLPATLAPLVVQATYIAASAILIEATLSFLGVGIPSSTPTWGNIMAEGRALFRVFPHNILYPGVFLAVTVLAVNLLGDGLRDALDPRATRR